MSYNKNLTEGLCIYYIIYMKKYLIHFDAGSKNDTYKIIENVEIYL